ncbi:DUF4192 domain-containing protein [Kitasatospora purpeofusca]|uniref:DUF4192 domain-containing protein n=1 Tax=Kitasatospora purpeofusca TaxID=67352 RepID=UPI0036E2A30E
MTDEHIALPFGDGPGGRSLTMRGPADMAEALPYLLGFFPDDSIVAVGLQPPGLHQGGVIRLDIPESEAEWPSAAEETAELMVRLSERQAQRPVQVLLYLCQDPAVRGPGREHGPPVAERLRPLAERLRQAFESRGVRVKESLCLSAGRWWSYLCTREGCCRPGGHPIRREPGPGPVAVAATVAGLAPRGSRKEILAGLAPVGPPGAESARAALARAGVGPGAAPGGRRPLDRREGARLIDTAVAEFMAGAVSLDDDRAARLLLALQDRVLRDRAAEYARPAELAPTRRLWSFLATRCVAPHERLAAPPLTLLAWVSWVAGDAATARVVLGHTLRRAPGYLLAQLLYESMNGGFAPEVLLASIEEERHRRTERERAESEAAAAEREAAPDPSPGPDLGGTPGPGPGPAGGGAAEPGPGGAGAGAPARGKARRGRRRRGRPVAGSPPVDTPPGPASRTADTADGNDSNDTAERPGHPAGPDSAGPDGAERDGAERDGVGRTGGTSTARGAGGGSTPVPPERRGGLRRARVPGPAPRVAAVLPGDHRRRGACGAERGQSRAR